MTSGTDRPAPLHAVLAVTFAGSLSGGVFWAAIFFVTAGHYGFSPARNLVHINVSDGVGVGLVVNGELLRGKHNIAGEFAHMPLSIDGPRCACGATGCWEAYVSNLSTLSRYFGREISPRKPIPAELSRFTVDEPFDTMPDGWAMSATDGPVATAPGATTITSMP